LIAQKNIQNDKRTKSVRKHPGFFIKRERKSHAKNLQEKEFGEKKRPFLLSYTGKVIQRILINRNVLSAVQKTELKEPLSLSIGL